VKDKSTARFFGLMLDDINIADVCHTLASNAATNG